MNFFSNILQSVKAKQAELKERKEFLDMVESKAKPIRRKAYLGQMLKEVIHEGIEKAKADAAKKNVKKQKTEQDFGINKEVTDRVEIGDPYKFLNQTKSKENKK